MARWREPGRRFDDLWTASWLVAIGLGILVVAGVGMATSAPSSGAAVPTTHGASTLGAALRVAEGANPDGRPNPEATLQVTLTTSPTEGLVNNLVDLTGQVNTSAGTPFSLLWSNLPTPCASSAPTSSSNNPIEFSCSPSQVGSYHVGLQVTNLTGAVGTGEASLVIYSPLAATLSASSASVTVGQPLTIDFQVTGGVSPYQLQWSGLPSGCAGVAPLSATGNSAEHFQCDPSEAGSTSIGLRVVDNATPSSNSAFAPSVPVSVDPSLSVSLGVSPSSVARNSPVTISFQVTGGVSPYHLLWMGLPGGCSGAGPTSTSNNGGSSFQCSPSQTGNFEVTLNVTDSASPTSNAANSPTQPLSVTSNSGGNGNGNGGSNDGNGSGNVSIPFLSDLGSAVLYLLIGVIIVFILIVITAVSSLSTAILLARRLPPRPKNGGPSPTRPCPSCGVSVPSGTKYCPECGKPMTFEAMTTPSSAPPAPGFIAPPAGSIGPGTQKYCPSCGTANPGSSLNCLNCGKPFPALR